MGFDIGNVFRVHIADAMSRANNLCLTVDTGGGITHFSRTVIINGGTFNYRMNIIAISQGFFQGFQHHNSYTFADNCPTGIGVKGPAVAVRGADHTLLVDITRTSYPPDTYSPGQGHIALTH